MPITAYNDYIQQLQTTIRCKRRDREAKARIQIAVCRNGYGYRSVGFFGDPPSEKAWSGPISSTDWEPDTEERVTKEVDRFFGLPQIFAYSERALGRGRNPALIAHWDATVAMFEISFLSGSDIFEQRMMFAGFEDPVHAEFSVEVDGDILVHDHGTGTHFYEWRKIPSRTESAVEPAMVTD